MIDTAAEPRDSLLRRLMRTPLTRLIRGKIGPLPSAREIAAALPSPAAEVVIEVARRTRLWRGEKAAVARELANHFRDGLEAGAAVEGLVRDFGDPRLAAKLIRRAKIRNRPSIWHAARWMMRGVAAIVLLYVALGVYYLMGEARPEVDYLAQFQAPLRAVPEEDRAWPLYREALVRMDSPPESVTDAQLNFAGLRHLWPGHESWEAMVEYAENHAETIALARRAAARPALGYVMGEFTEADRFLRPDMNLDVPADERWDRWDDALISILLPHLTKMRELARMLVMDIHRAAAAGDADAVTANLTAMLGLAGHAAEGGVLINQLVGVAILGEATREIDDLLIRDPRLVSDEQLVALAHALSAADDLVRLELGFERVVFYDIVQRIYTPGDGGHITLTGVRDLGMLGADVFGKGGPDGQALPVMPIYPAIAQMMLPRGELIAEYDRIMDLNQAQFDRPMWEWTSTVDRDHLRNLSSIDEIRMAPIVAIIPALTRAAMVGEWARAERDAAVVALALELHRRRHGQYPSSLEELVPGMLPEVPRDRFTGGAMKYRLIDRKPVLYSAGVDRDDDGGRPPEIAAKDRMGDFDPAREWNPPFTPEQLAEMSPETLPADGDWILFDGRGTLGDER